MVSVANIAHIITDTSTRANNDDKRGTRSASFIPHLLEIIGELSSSAQNSSIALNFSYFLSLKESVREKMGKKAKSSKGAQRAQARKLDKSSLPPPPKAVNEEVRPDAIDPNSNV